MIKGCIFDFDGTLANTLHSIAYFANQTLNAMGYPTIPYHRFSTLVGKGAKQLILNMMREVGLDTQDESLYTLLRKTYDDFYAADYMHDVTVYDGIPQLLENLKTRKIRTAVFSNKPDDMTQLVAKGLFGDQLLDIVRGQREGTPRKPSPDGALRIAEQWNIPPGECLYIGDTDVDMKTGNAAGMPTVGVLWGFRDRRELEENHALYIVSHPDEILSLPIFNH